MKKVLLYHGYHLVFIALIIPQVTFAAWWNPTTWFNRERAIIEPAMTKNESSMTDPEIIEKEIIKEIPVEKTVTIENPAQSQKIKELVSQLEEANKTIRNLRAQIENLQTQIVALSATSKPSPSSVSIQQRQEPSVRTDYNKYANVKIRDYAINPPLYLGRNITLRWGLVTGFTPAVDPVSDSQYIHVVDYNASPLEPDEVVLKIDDLENYAKASTQLEVGGLVNVNGVGVKSEEFKVVGGNSGQYTKYKPTVLVERLFKCTVGPSCDGVAPYLIFSK